MDGLTAVVLGLVTLQRLAELVIAQRNTAALLEKGGAEHGASHYPVMIALHGAWLIGLWLFAWGHPVSMAFLAAYAAVQGLRIWVLATLGRRWTTRIITVPGEALVARGPYVWLRHPNYVVVSLEIFILPMVWGLWWYAGLFTAANALMLRTRIAAEEAALKLPPQVLPGRSRL
jgi:methyltransferase